MAFILIKRNVRDVVRTVSGNVRECSACGATGLAIRYGLPARVFGPSGRLHHKPKCPMNAYLNDDGTLRLRKAKP